MQLLVTQVNVVGNTNIIVDDFESVHSFIIASPQSLKPVISILAWLPLAVLLNVISRIVDDGNNIRAPPVKS